MLKSSLCDYSDAYIIVKDRITTTRAGDNTAAKWAYKVNKGIMFKNCAPFTNSKSEINNIETDSAKDIDLVMPMCSLVEYSDNYSKISKLGAILQR